MVENKKPRIKIKTPTSIMITYCFLISMAILILLTIQFWNMINPKFIEGAVGSKTKRGEYYINPKLGEDPLFLAKTNAANIEYLRTRIEHLGQLQVRFADIKTRVDTNTSALKSLSESIHNNAANAVPDNKTKADLANSSSMGMNYK